MIKMDSRLKVAVIGTGPAGLCAVKYLISDPDHFEVEAFEQKNSVGGIWNYTESVGTDEYGVPKESSIYKNLRTNLPKEAMCFTDFPFPHCDGLSYLHHTHVLKYLTDYTKHFDLYKRIKFHKKVEHVKPLKHSDGKVEWFVTYVDVVTKEKETKTYDAVMVCNGRQGVPNVPEIPGLDDFQGIVMHSQAYRENTPFKDKRVVILGAGPSGEDIGFEIANIAKEVLLSHNSKIKTCPLPENMIQVKGVNKVDKTSVTLIDGQTYECDAILLCTGYLIGYPFLDPTCNLKIEDQRVTPLYFHTFHIDHPTLAFWAVTIYLLPFRIFEQQVQVFMNYLRGVAQLPSADVMREEEASEFQWRLDKGLKPSYAHNFLNERMWMLDDDLSKLGKIEPIPNCIRNLLGQIMVERDVNLMNYKDKNYKLVDKETFVELV